MSAACSSETRTPAGRFAPGVSGNPAGRPKGARNKATLAAEALFEQHGEGVLRTLIAAALGGDVRAACFLVDRIVPRQKGEFVEIAVDPAKLHDFVHVHGLVLQAACAGEISIEAAAKLSRILATGARLAKERRRAEERLRAADAATQPPALSRVPERAGVRASPPEAPKTADMPSPSPRVPRGPLPSSASGGGTSKPLSTLYFSTALGRVEAARTAPVQFPPVFSPVPGTLGRAA